MGLVGLVGLVVGLVGLVVGLVGLVGNGPKLLNSLLTATRPFLTAVPTSA